MELVRFIGLLPEFFESSWNGFIWIWQKSIFLADFRKFKAMKWISPLKLALFMISFWNWLCIWLFFEISFDASANIINRSLEIILNSIYRDAEAFVWHSQNATNCQLTKIASLSKTVNEIIMKIVSHNVNADKWQLISECQLHCIFPLQLVYELQWSITKREERKILEWI